MDLADDADDGFVAYVRRNSDPELRGIRTERNGRKSPLIDADIRERS